SLLACSYFNEMPASVITDRHLLVSLLMKAPNASAVVGDGSTLSSAKRCFTAGRFRVFRQAALSLAMTSGGVPAGAARPFQAQASKSATPPSATVGTSGSAAIRLSVPTPSPLI